MQSHPMMKQLIIWNHILKQVHFMMQKLTNEFI